MEIKRRGVFYKLGRALAKAKIAFSEGFYSPHIRIRWLHDKTYEKAGWYKNWTDKSYSRYIHNATFIAFIISFVIFSGLQNLFPYMFNIGKPRSVQAGANQATWTTQADFTNNNGTTGNTTFNPAGSIDLTSSAGDARISATSGGNTWGSLSSAPDLVRQGGSLVYSGAGDYIYAFKGNNTVTFWRYKFQGTGSNTWETMADAPGAVGWGGNLLAYPGTGDYIYALRGNSQLSFWRYKFQGTGSNTWETMANVPSGVGQGGSIIYPGSGDYLYANKGAPGGSPSNAFWRYKFQGTGSNTWEVMASAPNTIGHGGSLTYPGIGDYIYALGGNDQLYFWRYKFQGTGLNTWETMADAPNTVYYGGSLAYPGTGDYIYALRGNSATFWRYKFQGTGSNTWEAKADLNEAVGYGGSLCYATDSYLYAFPGGGSGSASFYRYSLPPNNPFNTSGTLGGSGGSDIGLRKDAGEGIEAKWSSIEFNVSPETGGLDASGQAIKFAYRTSDTGADGSWSALKGYNGAPIDWTTGSGNYLGKAYSDGSARENIEPPVGQESLARSRYIDIVAQLSSSGSNTPTLKNVKLTYNVIEAPTGLKQYRTDTGTAEIAAAGYTNESSATLKANVTDAIDNPSTLTSQVELNTTGSFSGTPGISGGPTLNGSTSGDGSSIPYLGSPIAGATLGTLSGLSAGTHYYWKVRYTDGSGRVSAWSTTSTDFSVEQTPPTVSSFSLNSGAQYASAGTRIVTASGIFNDAGGSSGTLDVQFSEDGTNWGVYSGSGTTNNKATDWTNKTQVTAGAGSQNITNAWYLEGSDGAKTVYVRTRDAAGNISGKSFTSTADFNAATLTGINPASDKIQLSTATGGTANTYLFWDGGTAPSGWTIVSDVGGQFYQKMPRGAATFGGTGGSDTHNHYGNGNSGGGGSGSFGTQLASGSYHALNPHAHGVGTSTDYANNLPAYKNLKVIKYTGVPSIIPQGAIGIFDSTVPTNWTRYSNQDNYFVRGEINNIGVAAGSNTHSHSAPVTTSNPSESGVGGGTAGTYLARVHSHTGTANTNTVDNIPPSIDVVLGKANIDVPLPVNLIAIFDSTDLGASWDNISSSGDPFFEKFIRGSASYGATTNVSTHSHSNLTGTLTGGNVPTTTSLYQANPTHSAAGAADHSHTYSIPLDTKSHVPAYINVIFAKSLGPYVSSGTLGGTGTGLRSGDPAGVSQKWTSLRWNGSGISATYKVKVQVRAADTWGSGDTGYVNPSDGTATWYEITSGTYGTIPISSSIPATKTLEIRLEIVGDGSNTATIYDIATEDAPSDGITLDTAAPNAPALSGPANNSWTSSTSPTLSWTPSDSTDVVKQELWINGALNKTINDKVTSSTTPTTPLAPSVTPYSWYIKAVDGAGNATPSTSTRNIGIDTSNPTSGVTITPSYVGPNTYQATTINGTAGDTGGAGIEKTEITIQRSSDLQYYQGGGVWGGITWLPVGAGGTWTYDIGTGNLANTLVYTVTSKTTDNATNFATSTSDTFTYDDGLPSSSITYPASDGKYNANSWTGIITGTASDSPAGINKVDVRIKRNDNKYYNGPNDWVDLSNTWKQATDTTSWSYAIAANQFTDGAVYTVDSRATDNALNVQTSFDTKSFTYDEASPTGTVTIANGNTYTKNLNVWLQFTAAGDVEKMAVSNNQADLTNIQPSDPLWQNYNASLSWSLAAGADGTRTVYAKFMDYATNISNSTYSDEITYDGTAATGAVTTPANAAKVNAVAQISGTATDATSGISNASQITVAIIKDVAGTDYYWDSALNGGAGDWATDQNWATADLLGGAKPNYTWAKDTQLPNDWTETLEKDYRVAVKANDDATNAGSSAEITFSYDKIAPSAPSVTSSTHASEATWYSSNNVTISDFTATDGYAVTGYSYAWSQAGTDPDESVDAAAPVSYNSQADGLWYFKVRARDEAGNWGLTNNFAVRIDTTGPGAPQGFQASGSSEATILVQWNDATDQNMPNASGVASYTVERTGALGGATPNCDTGQTYFALKNVNYQTGVEYEGGGAYSFSDSVSAENWYCYRAKAIDAAVSAGNSSTWVNFAGKGNFAPTFNDGDINISVSGDHTVDDVRSGDVVTATYIVTDHPSEGRADLDSGNAAQRVQVVDGDSHTVSAYAQSAKNANVANGYTYTSTYAVLATDHYGTYTISINVKDSVGTELPGTHNVTRTKTFKVRPTAPTGFSATGYTSTTVNLAWTPPPNTGLRGANRYSIERKLASENDNAFAQVGQTNETTYASTGLTMDQQYSFRVRAYDVSDNAGAYSTAASATPPLPDTPVSAVVKDASHTSVDLGGAYPVRYMVSWNAVTTSEVPDFKGYKVYRSVDSVWEVNPIAEINTVSLGYNQAYFLDIHSQADEAKVYKYRVATWDQANNIGSTAETLETNAALTPQITNQPTVTERGVNWVKISWKSSQSTAGLVKYKKSADSEYRNYAGDPKATTTQEGGNYVHTVTVRGLTKGTDYDFKVQSMNASNMISTESSKLTGATLPFDVSDIAKQTHASSATITWNTGQISSEGYIEYKKGNAGTPKVVGTGQNGTSHSAVVNDLTPGDYVFTLKNIDAEGNITTSGLESFSITGFEEGALSAPQAGKIEEQDITATSAKITWTSTVPTTSWVNYGTQSGVYAWSAGNDTLTIDHIVTLTNLTPGVTYYYQVRGKDANGTEYKSRESSFVALAKPSISSIKVSGITPYAATVLVDITKEVQLTISYGKDGNLTQKAGGAGLSKSHEVKLSDLEDGATYSLVAEAKDSAGNTATSASQSFSTPIDTEGPKISEVKLDLLPLGSDDETAQAIISWTTDKPSTTKVEYDEGVIGGKYGKASIEDKSLNNSHTVIVKDLNPATTYHFRLVSRDKRGNATISNDYNFVTSAKEKSIWQLILKSIEETFSWVKNVGGFFRNIGKKAK